MTKKILVDVKEIAEILKEWNHDYEAICEELANYFERETEERLNKEGCNCKNCQIRNFNPQQFKKGCGVK